MTTVLKAGVIGLGNMGAGLALSLQRAGHDVRSTSRTASSRSHAAALGINVAESVASVVDHAQVILLSLPDPDAVRSLASEKGGLLYAVRPGQMVIDTTTSDVPTTLWLGDELAKRGAHLVDGPVSGAPELARSGQLTMMISGTADDVAIAMPFLEAVSARRIHAGPLGSGQTVKLANNMAAAANLLIASEMAALVGGAGVETLKFLEAVNASTGRSFVTERLYPDWIERGHFDLGFTVGLMRKDLELAIAEIARRGLKLPVASFTAAQWRTSVDVVADAEDITRMAELPLRRASVGA